jgi:Arc/MetJ family transcription regulator
MNVTADPLTAARAEALFTSHLPAGSTPSYADVDAAIRAAVRARGGTRAVAGDVAAAYGDHPETAVPRMRWARCVVDQLYGSRRACATSGAR